MLRLAEQFAVEFDVKYNSNKSVVHSFIRFFNENTVITQWFNNMQCIKHVVTNKCL